MKDRTLNFSNRFQLMLEQFLLGSLGFLVSFWAINHLRKSDLAIFFLIWSFCWGAISVISELLITPARIAINDPEITTIQIKSKIYVVDRSLVAINQSFLFSAILLIICSFLFGTSTLKFVLLTIIAALSGISLNMLRFEYRFQLKSAHYLGELLITFLLLFFFLNVFIRTTQPTLTQLILVFSFSNLYLPLKFFILDKGVNFVSSFRFVFYLLKQNWIFGISTLLRTLLFSSLVIIVINLSQGSEATIQVGLLFFLSGPGIQLVTYLSSSLQIQILSNYKTPNFWRSIQKELTLDFTLLALFLSLLTIFWNILLSFLPMSKISLINGSGSVRVMTATAIFLIVVFISNLASLLVQLNKARKTSLSVSIISGVLGVLASFRIDPLIAPSMAYFFYSLGIFASLLFNFKFRKWKNPPGL